MITIHNFNEAYQQYQNGLISYRLLQDQAVVMLGLCSNPSPSVVNSLDITNANINWLLQQPEVALDYSDLLGGYFYVCESEADLLQILGCDFEWAEAHGGVWPNVTDLPMSWDNCCYLQGSADEPQWVLFLLCWNNAGGPVYYVPKPLWDVARISEHIAATDLAQNQ
jgi:hypothetical protein